MTPLLHHGDRASPVPAQRKHWRLPGLLSPLVLSRRDYNLSNTSLASALRLFQLVIQDAELI